MIISSPGLTFLIFVGVVDCRSAMLGSLLDFEHRRFEGANADLRRNFLCDLAKHPRARRIGLRDDDGLADIRLRADRKIQRHFSKEWNAQLLGCALSAAVSENVILRIAVRANVVAHVL